MGQSAYLGTTKATVLPNGIWNYTPAGSVNLSDPNSWLTLANQAAQAAVAPSFTTPGAPAYTAAQLPRVNGATTLAFQNPRINETFEKTAKLDLDIYTDEYIPFVPSIKVGYSRRKSGYDHWGTGGPTGGNTGTDQSASGTTNSGAAATNGANGGTSSNSGCAGSPATASSPNAAASTQANSC